MYVTYQFVGHKILGFFFFFNTYLMPMGVLSAFMSLYHIMPGALGGARRGCWIPGTGVTDACEQLCGCEN